MTSELYDGVDDALHKLVRVSNQRGRDLEALGRLAGLVDKLEKVCEEEHVSTLRLYKTRLNTMPIRASLVANTHKLRMSRCFYIFGQYRWKNNTTKTEVRKLKKPERCYELASCHFHC